MEYIKHLDDVNILNTVNKSTFGVSLLQKPEKIYSENTNLIFALGRDNTSIGNVRETFFLNQVGYNNEVNYPPKGDFMVNNQYLFEVGGKSKSKKQITHENNSFVVADDLEFKVGNKIPLWLFGFLY